MSEAHLLLDTNTLVSGLLWRGNEQRLLEAVLASRASGVITPFIQTELERVLPRLGLSSRRVEQAVAMLAEKFELVEVTAAAVAHAGSLLSAPHDAPVLAAARKAGAVLVTGDRRLRNDAARADVRAVTTREALALLPPGWEQPSEP